MYNIRIDSNTKAWADLLDRKADEFPSVVEKVFLDALTDIYLESRAQMTQQIYAQPIPVVRGRSSSRLAWRRTGRLLRGERMVMTGALSGMVDNVMPYAEHRHNLNRPSRIDGKVRRARWREAAIRRAMPRVQRRFERALKAQYA